MKKLIFSLAFIAIWITSIEAQSLIIDAWTFSGNYMTIQGSASGVNFTNIQLSAEGRVIDQQPYSGGRFNLNGNLSYISGSVTATIEILDHRGQVVFMARKNFSSIPPYPPNPPNPPNPPYPPTPVDNYQILVDSWHLKDGNMMARGTISGPRPQRIEMLAGGVSITFQYVNSGPAFSLSGYVGHVPRPFKGILQLYNSHGRVVATEEKFFGGINPQPDPHPQPWPSEAYIDITRWDVGGGNFFKPRAKIEGKARGRNVQSVRLVFYEGDRRVEACTVSAHGGGKFTFDEGYNRLATTLIVVEAIDNFSNVVAQERRSP